jgi:hypothetical protein
MQPPALHLTPSPSVRKRSWSLLSPQLPSRSRHSTRARNRHRAPATIDHHLWCSSGPIHPTHSVARARRYSPTEPTTVGRPPYWRTPPPAHRCRREPTTVSLLPPFTPKSRSPLTRVTPRLFSRWPTTVGRLNSAGEPPASGGGGWLNSLNSPKLLIDIILNTVNLDCLTCIQKFEVPLDVVDRTKMKIQKESNLNLNPLELGIYLRNHCRNIVATTVTPGCYNRHLCAPWSKRYKKQRQKEVRKLEGSQERTNKLSFSFFQTNMERKHNALVSWIQSPRQRPLCVGNLQTCEFHVSLHLSPLPPWPQSFTPNTVVLPSRHIFR